MIKKCKYCGHPFAVPDQSHGQKMFCKDQCLEKWYEDNYNHGRIVGPIAKHHRLTATLLKEKNFCKAYPAKALNCVRNCLKWGARGHGPCERLSVIKK